MASTISKKALLFEGKFCIFDVKGDRKKAAP
jgi:hypothetical protein